MAAAATPAFHITGAVHHYVQYVGIPTPIYLGTCESTPAINFQELTKDVKNDVFGPLLPGQRVEGGEMATISAALNRFSKGTLQAMLAVIGPARRTRYSRGQYVFGRNTFQLWQVFENYWDSSIRALYPNLEPGYYWPQVQLVQKQLPRMGNQDQLYVLNAEAHPYWTPQADATTVAAGEREFRLYSVTAADFPAAVQVPQ